MERFYLDTPSEGFLDITARVRQIVKNSNIQQGICQVFM
ncbi:YjbQ family protein [Sporomusa malonica]|nr:YjbQ family protein [Sporomusa malonica]